MIDNERRLALVEGIGQAVRDSKLENPKAQIILNEFNGFALECATWDEQVRGLEVTDESQTVFMKAARVARLSLKEIRIHILGIQLGIGTRPVLFVAGRPPVRVLGRRRIR